MKRHEIRSSLIILLVFLAIFTTLLFVICPLKANNKPKQIHYGVFTWTQVEKKNKDGNSVWVDDTTQYVYLVNQHNVPTIQRNSDGSPMKLEDYLAYKASLEASDSAEKD